MALTLGIKPGEKVYIIDGHDRQIEVEVVKGFTAPQEFRIVRGEIHQDNNS